MVVRRRASLEGKMLAFSALLPVRVGVWSKLDLARFVRVDFQAGLPESGVQVRQEPFSVLSVFEAHHAI
jgi:hypothetical protein